MNQLRWIGAVAFSVLPIMVAAQSADDDTTACLKQLDSSPHAAIVACTRAIELGQLSRERLALAFFFRGIAWKNNSEYDKAIADYDQAIRLDPQNARAFYGRGLALSSEQEYDKAIADYDQAIRLDPQYADAVGLENDKVIAELGQAIRLNPQDATAFRNRGDAWINKAFGNKEAYDKAIVDYDEAIRLNPKDALAFFGRGRAWDSKGERDKAFADYGESIRLNPKDARAFLARGTNWASKSEYDRAIVDYSQAILLDPKYAIAFEFRSYAWTSKREYGKALEDCESAVRLEPSEVIGLADCGTIRFYLGQFDRAAEDMRRALDDSPLRANVLLWLYLARARSVASDGALAELAANDGKITEREWPAPVIDYYLGRIGDAEVLAAARHAEATLDADAKKYTDPTCEANFYLGEWQVLKRNMGAATRHFQAAREGCPHDSQGYHGALVELQRLRR